MRFVIFTDDHEPAHVHAIGGGGEAKIDLGDADDPPRLIWTKGLTNTVIRRAMSEVAANRTAFMDAWVRIHGEIDE